MSQLSDADHAPIPVDGNLGFGTAALVAAPPAPAPTSESSTSSPHVLMDKVNRPILVVDDDWAILQVVREALELEGFSVATADDGAGALEAVDRQRPALVLLDMRMPGMNGWEFARCARERGFGLKIVAMTAARDAEAWARQIDAAGLIEKPFELDQLIAVVERFAATVPVA